MWFFVKTEVAEGVTKGRCCDVRRPALTRLHETKEIHESRRFMHLRALTCNILMHRYKLAFIRLTLAWKIKQGAAKTPREPTRESHYLRRPSSTERMRHAPLLLTNHCYHRCVSHCSQWPLLIPIVNKKIVCIFFRRYRYANLDMPRILSTTTILMPSPRLTSVWTPLIPICKRDPMVQRTIVAGRVLSCKPPKRIPVATHTNGAHARGHAVGLVLLRM